MAKSALIKPIVARDTQEPNRVSTTLELLFDLVYVIAVSAAASGFYQQLRVHDLSGFLTFTVAFFILWNAWTSFTWFASGYDPDDVVYRISVMLQMFGSLMIAANINQFYDQGLMWIGVTGYAIMRLASCSQWWRVYRNIPDHRQVALRSIVGLFTLQSMWIIWLFLPKSLQTPSLFLFIFLELFMPLWARSEKFHNWHPGHIAERYGLLTIIVLGEGVVGISSIIHSFVIDPTYNAGSIIVSASGLVALLFSMWWLYFSIPFDHMLSVHRHRRDLFVFGYGHFFVFASIAGLSSALKLVMDTSAVLSSHPGSDQISETYVIATIMPQLAAFLLTLTLLRTVMCKHSKSNLLAFGLALIIIALSFVAVTLQLPLTYAIWMSVLAPVVMIIIFAKDHNQWYADHPQFEKPQ
ncbi:low temperature requirement protein A [Psychrobacter sp. FDAARGOS_221]|uniref:low temperature requirement protein A n=1 Tax=Psychrobacter sp. FDAARGOS_221 TaxID=1975705 RepID=UPI000BB57F54|nr:low temperature requirement protein A [Psychrobacter sp. FDAARGOS_221]PNK60920.1 low temperature requirement protein A [Psychrobacter sp. FDAARGOS_221]